jgi:8-hydroxy-5-deazaflavin:NADPH oxidoreductase
VEYMSKKIGIVGSGIVGQTLANGFIKHGYDVMIATNTASKREELRSKTHGKAKVGSFEEAARFGEVVVLATKGTAAERALNAAGIDNLRGRTVIDTTNPIADAPPINGVLPFFTSHNESLMERLQKLAPETRFVKAFSCIGNALMVNPDFNGAKPTTGRVHPHVLPSCARAVVLRPRPNAVEGRRCERFPRLANPCGPTEPDLSLRPVNPKAHPSLSTQQKKVREAVKTVRSTLSWMREDSRVAALNLREAWQRFAQHFGQSKDSGSIDCPERRKYTVTASNPNTSVAASDLATRLAPNEPFFPVATSRLGHITFMAHLVVVAIVIPNAVSLAVVDGRSPAVRQPQPRHSSVGRRVR